MADIDDLFGLDEEDPPKMEIEEEEIPEPPKVKSKFTNIEDVEEKSSKNKKKSKPKGSFMKKITGWFRFHFTVTNVLVLLLAGGAFYYGTTQAIEARDAVENVSNPLANRSAYIESIGRASAQKLSTESQKLSFDGWQFDTDGILFYFKGDKGQRYFSEYDGRENKIGQLNLTLPVSNVEDMQSADLKLQGTKAFGEETEQWKLADEIVKSLSGQGSVDKSKVFTDRVTEKVKKYITDKKYNVTSVTGNDLGTLIYVKFSSGNEEAVQGLLKAQISEGKVANLDIY